MMEALSARIGAHFAESAQLKLDAAAALAAPIARAGVLLAETLKRGGKVLACGNGGSAADAQHFAAELLNRFEVERAPLAAVALTGNGGGRMGAMLSAEDVHVCVPHKRTARIQEVHLLVLHCLCDGIDFQLSGAHA